MDDSQKSACTITHRSIASNRVIEHGGYVYSPFSYFPLAGGVRIYHRVTSLDGFESKAPFDPEWLACHDLFSTWVDLERISCETFNKPFLTLGFLNRLRLLAEEFSINVDDHTALATVERMTEKVD